MSHVIDPDQKAVSPSSGLKTRRVLRKKQTPPKPIKKYVWLSGHSLTLLCGGLYFGLYIAKYIFRNKWYWIPRISYRLSFIGVIMAYSITVLTTFGTIIPNYYTLLATENFQNLLLAFVWLISRPSAFKLAPFYIISILQFSDKFNVKPVLKIQDSLVDLITISEVVVFVALIFDTLIFRGTSGYALVIYTGFYWLRINFSPYTQTFILKVIRGIDEKIMAKQSPKIQEKWQKAKDFVEFRREQTRKAIAKGLDREPDVVPSDDHPDAGKPLGHAENYQMKGQPVPDAKRTKQLASEGVKVPYSETATANYTSRADQGEAPAGVGRTESETYEKNFKAGVMASTAAAGSGFAAGAASEGARIGRQQNEHPTSKIPAQEQPRDHLARGATTNSSSSTTPPSSSSASTPGAAGGNSSNVAPASGRIQPGTASSPVQRQQGFASGTAPTDQARLNLDQRAQQVERQAYDARANLTEIQRRTQAGIASTQGQRAPQQVRQGP